MNSMVIMKFVVVDECSFLNILAVKFILLLKLERDLHRATIAQ